MGGRVYREIWRDFDSRARSDPEAQRLKALVARARRAARNKQDGMEVDAYLSAREKYEAAVARLRRKAMKELNHIIRGF